MMYEIEVADRQSLLSLNASWVESIVQKTLSAEQVCAASISVALLDDAAIHQVNRDHLEHDYPTDVISFLYDAEAMDDHSGDQSELRGRGLRLEGEILVSTETALRMAREFNWPPEAETTLYIVHGLLHLCGYDDLSAEEQAVMRAREQAVLKIWNLTPHYQE